MGTAAAAGTGAGIEVEAVAGAGAGTRAGAVAGIWSVAEWLSATAVSMVGAAAAADDAADDDDDDGAVVAAAVAVASSLSAQRIGFSGRVYKMFTSSAFSLAIRAVTMTVEVMS
jgi:hypothetical protein